MEYDEHSTQVVNFVSGLVLGAILGAGVALLTAPQSGRRTRRRLQRSAVDVRSTAGDRWEDLSSDVKSRVDEALDGARSRFKR
jgi:gas vesicle protein